MQTEKIFEGVADRDKTFELINRGYTPDVFKAGQWFEIEESEYWYFLECLPPMYFDGRNFAMCEFATGDLTSGFFASGERYFLMTVEASTAAQFRAWKTAMFEAIKEEEFAQ